ncbi:hypothetical protein CBR_g41604 [Chara braunii]|uniref:Reverse transcriptase domain-containing protein n=1 Tax=Chara braunii TaxID=69332 RepID=A0A388LW98_CHABU|nr:hypothetical protein CBR_g41604 [Chara braunii]|eukprot:GBG86541.1 hypothetical protein CBR_g41604 [Chara braunii]
MAELLNYLHVAVPTPLMEDGVVVVDLREYIAKIDHEYATQMYDNIDAPLLYIRIQIGKSTCNALIDCGATHNYISQHFMASAGPGSPVRRKSQPTQVTWANGHTHKSIDWCIDSVPVYFAPHVLEAVSFDILDTKFDMILGMSWLRSSDHLMNFYCRTVHVHDWNGVLVPCKVSPPHPSIGCHVVSTTNIRNSIARHNIKEMGICFLHALPPPDEPATKTPPDPRIVELLDSYGDVFEAPAGIVPDQPIRHEIIFEDRAVPLRECIYRMSEEELEVLRMQLDELIAKGWICPRCSPYGASVLFVRKKNKELCLCIDYCKLNAQTVKNVSPLPRIDDLLERLGGAKYFSKLDLEAGYHQLEIHPRDRYKTAFKTWYGHFEWVVMPFGLTNATTTFQATMTTEFRDMLDRFVLMYLDNILVYSWTFDGHITHVRAVLDRLRMAKYKANQAKCEFAQQDQGFGVHHALNPDPYRGVFGNDGSKYAQDVMNLVEFGTSGQIAGFLAETIQVELDIERHRRLACSCSRILPRTPSPRTSSLPVSIGGGLVSSFGRLLPVWMSAMSSVVDMLSVGDGDEGRPRLSDLERAAVTSAVPAVIMHCETEVEGERRWARLRARRRKVMQPPTCEGLDSVAISDAVFEVCCALGCGGLPRATPRWWVKRRTGGTWEDIRPADDATEDYFRDKLRMSPRVFREIVENLSPILERRVTFYREPLQPDHIVTYALYRWASGETYESSNCGFGIGRASGLVAVRDVTAPLLSVYREKVARPSGVRKAVVLRAFADKGFPNRHGCIDCTHIYINKSANAAPKDYYDRKRRFSVVAQVVVDLDLRVLHVFMGYPGSCHDVRVIHLSSLWPRAAAGELFTGPPVLLPFQVQTNGYLLGDNGYPPSEWIVVPYGGTAQTPFEARFDSKQKTARGAVERAFGRLKGMWRLFLGSHKTNMETLLQQFVVVCILHNILIDAGIPFDENLLWEVDANGVRRRVDLGIQRPPRPLCMETSTGEAVMLRQALAERMMQR